MQAYQSNNKEKGLFTFYREQAEIEEKLSLQKKYIKQKQNESTQTNDGSLGRNRVFSPKNNTNSNQNEAGSDNKKKQEIQKNGKHQKGNGEYNKRLLQILQKHKYGRNKKNVKMILKVDEQDDISLKYHLEALMVEDEPKEEGKQLVFVGKKSQFVKANPFQKVALCPTNFQSQLEQMVKMEKNKKFVYLHQPILPSTSTQEVKKIDKIQSQVLRPQMKSINQVLQKSALPKIGLPRAGGLIRDLSMMIDKQKLDSKSSRIYKQNIEPLSKVRSDRYRFIGKSLCIDSARGDLQSNKIRSSFQNKIYPIFIENKDSRKSEAEVQQSKQKLYVEVIRRLKFT